MDNDSTYNHLRAGQRIRIFMYEKKHRFLIFFGLWVAFLATGNAFCFVLANFERSVKKTRKRFVTKNYPDCIALKSAFETEYEPTKLSRRSTTLLSDKFIEIDRKLKSGFTNHLMQKSLVEHIDSEQRGISLKHFLVQIESRSQASSVKEAEFI